MDLALFTQWAGAVGLALGIINMGWNMLSRSTKGITDRQERHSNDLKEHDRRIQSLEGLVPHLPTSAQIADLRETVGRLDVHVSAVEKTIDVFSKMVTRIDDYLRENKS